MTVKRQVITSVALFILTMFFLTLCLLCAESTCKKFTGVTQANYNLSSSYDPLRISSLERFGLRISYNLVSFACEQENTETKEYSVTPVLTNHSYFSLSNTKVNGGITQEHTDNKAKVAVISSSLAVKLFFSTDCIGRTLTMNGTEYTVCGVYYSDGGILQSLSCDGKERVYIPYTCIESYRDAEIQTLIYDNSSRCAPLIEQICTTQYHLTNLNEKSKVINTLEHLTLLYIFLVICAVVLNLRNAVCQRLLTDIKANLNTHYFFRSLVSIPHKYLLFVLSGIVLPLLLLLLYFKLDFNIFIVSKYIPDENLFDISDYLLSIKENAQYMNSLALIGNTYLPVLYERAFRTVAVFGALSAWLFTAFICSVQTFLKKLKIKITTNG